MVELLVELDYKTIIAIVTILLGALSISRILKLALDNYVQNLDAKGQHNDKTPYTFLKNTISFLIWLVAALSIVYAIPFFRSVAVTLFAGAGVFAAFIAFASQKAFGDIVSGIFIVIFKPFRVGDVLHITGIYGIVEDITLRHTILRGLENRRLVIPNSVISADKITNSSIGDPFTCQHVEFCVDFATNIDLAIKIMQEEAMKHPDYMDNRTAEEISNNKDEVEVLLVKMLDSGMLLRAYVWCKDPITAFDMGCHLNKSIKERFDEAGIVIPYPHRVLVNREIAQPSRKA
ncbi:MAG: mechanosensitive ion channel family protein [Cytophagales bacterium]|nr:MAG: mechanosensitive ion channel family protein [Cytophagales bacterium]TAF61347.1 MAG: mechanosensitive ion channel family protein [Cytophagales bacterium]